MLQENSLKWNQKLSSGFQNWNVCKRSSCNRFLWNSWSGKFPWKKAVVMFFLVKLQASHQTLLKRGTIAAIVEIKFEIKVLIPFFIWFWNTLCFLFLWSTSLFQCGRRFDFEISYEKLKHTSAFNSILLLLISRNCSLK